MRIATTGLIHEDRARASRGYLLLRPLEGERTFLLDPSGEVAHEWRTGPGNTNWSYLLPNGHLFTNEMCEEPRGVSITVSGRMAEYDREGRLIWRHDDPYQHHDARRLGDGAIYAAFSELTETEKARIPGGAPGTETENGPYGEVIRRVDEAGEVVWEWSLLNLDLERFPLHRNANRWSYGHVNTVAPTPAGKLLISAKNLNLLFILDPATDEVVWTFQNDELGGQHDAMMLETGTILCFANGAYASDLHHSQVWEIDPKTNEIVWRYAAKDNMTSFFSPHISGAQRLPSGATLICEGCKGCIFEVTPEGEIVREFVSPHFVQSEKFGRHNWLFRARWYAEDAEEIRALGL